MQEKFSQAMNMLHTTDLNSNSLPPTRQANNITADRKVTNAQLFTFLKNLQNKVDRLENNTPSTHIATTSNTNPKTGKNISSDIVFHVDIAHIGENMVQSKSRDIRMMRPSRTEWVIVTKIVCPIVRDWRGEQTYQLIY